MAITIRPATRADIPTLGRLAALLVRAHADFDARRFIAATPDTASGYGDYLGSRIGKRDVAVLVAESGGEIIGYAYAGVEGYDYMALRGPAGALYDIVVDPEHRREGVGRMLLQAALEFLGTRGAPRVVLSTATQNVAAHRLFESSGFRPTMIEMTKELEPPD